MAMSSTKTMSGTVTGTMTGWAHRRTSASSPPAARIDTAHPADPTDEAPPWAALCPEHTVTVPATRASTVLASLAPGTSVALVANRPFSRLLLRRLCRTHGVRIDRELVALPSVDRPLVLFDDTELSVRRFWTGIATIPPAPGWVTAPATLVLSLAVHAPWQWTGAVVPGRVLLGERR